MKRREFLKGSASVAALLALPSLVHANEWRQEKVIVFASNAYTYDINGPVTLSIDGGPTRTLMHADGSEVLAGDIQADQLVEVRL